MAEGTTTIIHLCPRSTSYRTRGNNVDYMGCPDGVGGLCRCPIQNLEEKKMDFFFAGSGKLLRIFLFFWWIFFVKIDDHP